MQRCVYDRTGDGSIYIEINAFCCIAAILGSIASSLFANCSKRQCIALIEDFVEEEYKQ